jgi:hypothetical protein
MRFTHTACAYGLFQVVFADVADHLAVATFRLRERKEPSLTLEAVFGQRVSDTLKQFRKELGESGEGLPVSESVADLRGACDIIAKLFNWRNDRIHARVRMTEDGYALYDKRTGHRFELNREQLENNIQQAVQAIVTLKANVQNVVGRLEWHEEFEKMFREIKELPEP